MAALSLRDRWRLALKYDLDPRNFNKVLAGKAVRGVAGERTRAALEAEGLLPVESRFRLDSGPGLDVGTLADDGGSR
jgi:hypothetical protein